ncbi:Twin-arginine translocation pathway signal [Marivita sp.]|uniref:Twin-arginine translocation pathway signal n=1 Tax=Marivita sp. TaxID=2003365 RepID=UPI00260E5263|nr:Twin-arginine translocation pathway signal [Marivita sp.]
MSIRKQGVTRRQLLSQSALFGASFLVGTGFVAGKAEAANWALAVEHLKPETMATLIQMARDIYPHDQVSDEFYAVAVKGYDTADTAEAIEVGVAVLNEAAKGIGYANYTDIGWERDRVDLLRRLEDTAFFQQIRGGLVTGLYNQKAVWPIFGYEGESYTHGGYIDRGFDDINWL